MSTEIKKIYNLLFSVGFSSIGFIAAITVTALAVREVTTNPYLVGIPNALGVGGAFVGTQIFDYLQKKYSRMLALANTFFVGAIGGVVCFISLLTNSFNLLIVGAFVLGIGQSASCKQGMLHHLSLERSSELPLFHLQYGFQFLVQSLDQGWSGNTLLHLKIFLDQN